MHLASKHAHSGDALPYAMSYEKYVEHYVITPEEAMGMSNYDRKLHRQKFRAINKNYARSTEKRKETKRQKTIKARTKAKIAELLEKLNTSITAEDYMLLIDLPCRKANFDWISNDFYPGRPNIDIESRYSQWITMGKIFKAKLEKSKISKSHREAKIYCVRFLFDYIFCYLPHWKELHPNSPPNST
jgi:hypothetical protein